MASRRLYKHAQALLIKWPKNADVVDEALAKRDLGHFLRTWIGREFPKGETTSIAAGEVKALSERLAAFQRLADNLHGSQYPRPPGSSSLATGLTVDEVKQVLNSDLVQYQTGEEEEEQETRAKKEKKPWWKPW